MYPLSKSADLSAAVDACRSKYGCKAIKNQGDYRYLVKTALQDGQFVQIGIPQNSDEQLDVILRGANLTEEDRESFSRHLSSSEIELSPNSLVSLVQWVSARHSQPSNDGAQSPDKATPQSSENTKRPPRPAVPPTNGAALPNRPLKTVHDVVSRLLWDDRLPSRRFTVGYLDRFVGIVERPFDSFSWQHFSDADPDDNAVPRHRVQYFRCGATKVWDKKSRLDLIFGSGNPPTEGPKSVEEVLGSLGGEEEEGSDGQLSEAEEGTDLTDVPDGCRPDFFLSVPILSQDVQQKLSEAQASIDQRFESVVKSGARKQSWHVTVALFVSSQLAGGVSDAVEALKQARSELETQLADCRLTFRGLQVLQDYRVVVARPTPESIRAIVRAVASALTGRRVRFYTPDTPHLTLFKLGHLRDADEWAALEQYCQTLPLNVSERRIALSLRSIGGGGGEMLPLSEYTSPGGEIPPPTTAATSHKWLGVHVKNATELGGLEKAVYQAASLQARSMALFLQRKDRWDPYPLSDEECERFRLTCKDCGMEPGRVVVHGAYVLQPDRYDSEERLRRTRDRMVEDVRKCERLGIGLYCFHAGSHGSEATDRKMAVDAAVATVNAVIAATSGSTVTLLVETGAGQGGEICDDFSEIATILNSAVDRRRVGVCLDTCHVFAAGHDLRTPQSYTEFLQLFDREIGLQHLKAVHLNDSKGALGCRKDNHEIIGRGQLGVEAFKNIMNDRRFDGIPLILETPPGEDNHFAELRLLESLEAGDIHSMEQLDEQMRSFYESSRQSSARAEHCERERQRLEAHIRRCVDADLTLVKVGSCASSLATRDSDLDLCLTGAAASGAQPWQTRVDLLRRVETAARSLAGVRAGELRAGVVPVLRLALGDQLRADVACDERAAVCAATLLRRCAACDAPRFAAVAVVVKRWAAAAGLSEARQGFLNSYCFVLLLLHYMQTIGELPDLAELADDHYAARLVDDNAELEALLDEAFSRAKYQQSTKTAAELLVGFFGYYSAFPFETRRVSVRGTQLRQKQSSDDDKTLVYIEDPFELKNQARCIADSASLETIRSAFKHVYSKMLDSPTLMHLNL